jgi:hypothetical protein
MKKIKWDNESRYIVSSIISIGYKNEYFSPYIFLLVKEFMVYKIGRNELIIEESVRQEIKLLVGEYHA